MKQFTPVSDDKKPSSVIDQLKPLLTAIIKAQKITLNQSNTIIELMAAAQADINSDELQKQICRVFYWALHNAMEQFASKIPDAPGESLDSLQTLSNLTLEFGGTCVDVIRDNTQNSEKKFGI